MISQCPASPIWPTLFRHHHYRLNHILYQRLPQGSCTRSLSSSRLPFMQVPITFLTSFKASGPSNSQALPDLCPYIGGEVTANRRDYWRTCVRTSHFNSPRFDNRHTIHGNCQKEPHPVEPGYDVVCPRRARKAEDCMLPSLPTSQNRHVASAV